MSQKPLAGIRVLDFTRFYAGPYCTMLLGDLGADVVKIEQPGGDPTRHQGPPSFAQQSMSFMAANRNKRSVILDLQSPEGVATARALALEADILVENYRPSVMRKWGLDYENLHAANDRLIYISISGMGADGPAADKGAFDLTIQAEAGYMSITGERGGAPIKLGTSAFDLVCAQYAMSAATVALLHREKTGHGQKIETSLFESQITFLVDAALDHLLCGVKREKWGSEHAGQAPYKAFQTKDGWLVIGAGFQKHFSALCDVLGRKDICDDPRFATVSDRVSNRDAINASLQEEIIKYDTNELQIRLEAVQIPAAKVNSIDEVFKNPQTLHRGMLQTLHHPVYGNVASLGAAAKYSAFDVTKGWTAPPLAGEHNQAVIDDWLSRAT